MFRTYQVLLMHTAEEIDVDDVHLAIKSADGRYVLTARRLLNGWFADWTCCESGKRGVNGVVYGTPEAALSVTARNLGIAESGLGGE